MTNNLETKESDMMNEQPKKLRSTLFQKTFGGTIIIFFIITMVVIILGAIHHSDNALKEAHNERVLSADSLKKITPVLGVVYRGIDTIAYPKSFQDDISHKVDEAFRPVYRNISKFADMHYSVIGEYTEIGLAATGDLASSIQTRLLHGFNEEKLSTDVGELIPNVLQQMMKELTRDEIKKRQIPVEEQQAFKQAIKQALEKHMTKFRMGMTLGGGVSGATGGAVGGIATVKLMSTMIARNLLVKLGVKLAAKLALKSGSAAGMAAAGATIGSVVPVTGTIVGGIVGAIVGWVAVDATFSSVDEWLNRDEFEADLRMEITQQKEIMKKQFIQYANDIKSKLSTSGKTSFAGKTPSDL